MKIKIESSNGISFTENDLKIIESLEGDLDFEKFVKSIRKIYKIPEDIENYNKPNLLDEKTVSTIETLAVMLVKIYKKLATHWYAIFAGIIMTGVAKPTTEEDSAISIEFEDESPFDTPYRKELRIVVRKQTSISAIKTYLDKNKQEIDDYLKELPGDPIIRMKNIGFRKKVNELKKLNPNKHYSKIVENVIGEMNVESPEEYLDYNTASIYNKNYQDWSSKHLGKSPEDMQNLKDTLNTLRLNQR